MQSFASARTYSERIAVDQSGYGGHVNLGHVFDSPRVSTCHYDRDGDLNVSTLLQYERIAPSQPLFSKT